MDDPEKPAPPPAAETLLPTVEESVVEEDFTVEINRPAPLLQDEFPERIDCSQCRRPYRTETLRTRTNTLLTETLLTCPRCRRKLNTMRLKDWYDHYVQGQTPEVVIDEQTFAPKMLSMPQQPSRQFAGPNNKKKTPERRPNNRRRRHGRRQRR